MYGLLFLLAFLPAFFDKLGGGDGGTTTPPSSASAPQFETSEEYPPLVCPPNTFVQEVHCRGDNCDFVGITCRPILDSSGNWLQVSTGSQEFRPYTSEEQPVGAQCRSGQAMVGLSCTGRYCAPTGCSSDVYGRNS